MPMMDIGIKCLVRTTKYIYRIARMIQEKVKELAVIETIDGGKQLENLEILIFH